MLATLRGQRPGRSGPFRLIGGPYDGEVLEVPGRFYPVLELAGHTYRAVHINVEERIVVYLWDDDATRSSRS